MNKTKKRQLNIKNKLIAAIAMLLVSSIMMVSTTYAWFTLSTAPEVQGITTTVGANGNLEIALSPKSGNYNEITSGTTDATLDWVDRNQTWGNLLDLSDSSYRLDELTLLPSRLNISEAVNANEFAKLSSAAGDSPLAIPVYGADGRISALDATKVFLGGYQTVGESAGFVADNNVFGVRAMGTSSAMSPDALAFNNALSALGSGTTAANNIVASALNSYGAALADMAVLHATANGTDDQDYKAYVDELQAISAELVKASDSVETALYNALLALAKSNAANAMSLDPSLYGTIKDAMDNNVDLTATWGEIGDANIQKMRDNEHAAILVAAYEKWAATDAAVADNKAKVDALPTDGTKVDWSSVSTAMSGLMNTNHVTIGGYPISAVKENIVKIMSKGGVVLELNAGSGVIANFGELTGNIVSNVKLSENLEYNGTKLGGMNVSIATATEPAAGALLVQTKTLISTVGVYEDADAPSTSIIDVIYGYAIDFVFRTNAANSNLMLQTNAAQRIYGESSSNAATMGNGSSITFDGTSNNFESLVSMMSGIRVVFTDPANENVYGIAKVHFNETEVTMVVIPVTRTIEVNTTGEGTAATTTAKEVFTKGTGAEQTLKLTVVSGQQGNDKIILTSEGLADHQYIVWEKYTDPDTKETYVKATIKTALWYTAATAVTTTPYKADGTLDEANKVESTGTIELEVTDKNGNLVFYEEKETVNAAGTDKDTMTAEQFTAWCTERAPADKTYDLETFIDENGNQVETEVTVTKATALTNIEANYKAPVYQYVEDQAITLEGPLSLYNYTVNNGMLTFQEPMDVPTLVGLDQNVATGVTAMVYLDGDYVGNDDVVNSENGISNSGTLNLQFASSANLVPMQDTSLMNSIGVKLPEVEGMKISGETMVSKDADYKFSLIPDASNNKPYVVYYVYDVVDENGNQVIVPITTEPTGVTGPQEFTIPGAQMKTNIEIFVEYLPEVPDAVTP